MNNHNGQAYGYTLYETTITSGGALQSGDSVRDRALVSLRDPWRSALVTFSTSRDFKIKLDVSTTFICNN